METLTVLEEKYKRNLILNGCASDISEKDHVSTKIWDVID